MEKFRTQGVVLNIQDIEYIIRTYIKDKFGWYPTRIQYNITEKVAHGLGHTVNSLKSITATEEQHEYPETDSV